MFVKVAAVPDANPLNFPAVRVFVAASYEISVPSTETATPEAVVEAAPLVVAQQV
jgi:hypothetical protein